MSVTSLLKSDDTNFPEKNVLSGNSSRPISLATTPGTRLLVSTDWSELGLRVELNVGRICKVAIDFSFPEAIDGGFKVRA